MSEFERMAAAMKGDIGMSFDDDDVNMSNLSNLSNLSNTMHEASDHTHASDSAARSPSKGLSCFANTPHAPHTLVW